MNEVDAERLARVSLSVVLDPGHGPVLRQVSAESAAVVWRGLVDGDPQLDPTGRYQRLARDVDGQQVLERAAAQGVSFLAPGDAGWPDSLADLSEAALTGQGGLPVGLWLRGSAAAFNGTPSVAVVGSRAATRYGVEVAADISLGLAEAGACVVSGAAYGIDAAAHRGALLGQGATVAVLAGGVDVPYPRGNTSLIERIAERGAVVSEAAPGRTVTRRAFLARNRLIAALAVVVVLVEAGARSGARNTVNWGEQLSRGLCAVPGPVTSAMSSGPHRLIRDGQPLVTSAQDVLELAGPFGEHTQTDPGGPWRLWDDLSEDARTVLDAFDAGTGCTVAELGTRTGFGVPRLLSLVGELTSLGAIRGTGDLWHLDRGASP